MKLSRRLAVAGVCVGASGVLAAACGSSGSGGGSGSADQCGASVNCKLPPTPPSGPATTVAKTHNYAMHKLYLGDSPRPTSSSPNPAPDANAWKAFGYNLDNLVTAKDSTDVCTLAPGASKITQIDGTGGVDNSFGENIMPIVITTAGQDAGKKINDSIQQGGFTVMTVVTGFDDSSKQTATGLSGVLLAGGKFGADAGAPSWDLNTHWPVRPELLNCPNSTCPAGTDPVAAAKIRFPSAYDVNGTFVNGTPGDLDLALSIGGQSLDISIHHALITFDQQAAGSVQNGTIAGVINTEELITSLKSVAGHISQSLCSGSAFDSIASQIRQASDIVVNSNGSVSNQSGTPCNGISIGLGFDATEIAAPQASDIAPPTQAAPDPCADAGGGGG